MSFGVNPTLLVIWKSNIYFGPRNLLFLQGVQDKCLRSREWIFLIFSNSPSTYRVSKKRPTLILVIFFKKLLISDCFPEKNDKYIRNPNKLPKISGEPKWESTLFLYYDDILILKYLSYLIDDWYCKMGMKYLLWDLKW